jgi:uncharacterized membrane protein
MSEIVVAKFPNATQAAEARSALTRLGRTYEIEPEDIEIVSRSRADSIAIQPEVNLYWAHVIGGAIWGGVLGVVFLMPAVGIIVGAAVGFVTGRITDVGIRNTYLESVGRQLEKGEAAVALLARRANPGAVAEVIRRFGGTVMRSSLSGRHRDQIRTVTAETEEETADADGGEKAELRDQPKLA